MILRHLEMKNRQIFENASFCLTIKKIKVKIQFIFIPYVSHKNIEYALWKEETFIPPETIQ